VRKSPTGTLMSDPPDPYSLFSVMCPKMRSPATIEPVWCRDVTFDERPAAPMHFLAMEVMSFASYSWDKVSHF
jgi:hypothetical protein